MQIRMFTIHRVVQGKIVEDWVSEDSIGMMRQIGVLPTPA